MAIPTLPGPKRRRGAGNEVAEFAKAFMQGYRIFSADQRRSGSRANDPYSDENLAKYDQRLGGNFMSKLFGSGDEVTGADRGALRLQAIMKAAEERGDVATWEKTRDSLYKLNELQKKGELLTPGGTSRDIVTPEKRAAVDVDAPMPVARPPEFAQNNEDYQPQQQQQQQQQMAALDDSYAQPDLFEPEVLAARGGIIERPSITAGVAIPIGDEEEEKQAPSAPVGADLPDDPEALSDYAAEAIDAGYRKLSRDLAPGAAMPDEDPDYNARVEGYARGTNRMSDAEVAALDAIVDPTGELPTATRSAARMAAIYKFYKDQGDDETAEDVAARLVQYNKFAGQTRAMLGMQAIEQGKVQEGVKLIADAYEQNVPDGKSVEATVNPDGSVNVAVGYMKRDEDGRLSLSPEISERIPLDQLPQFAFAVTKEGERVLMGSAAAKADAARAARSGGSEGSNAPASGADLQKALTEVRAAGDELRAAQKSGDADAVAKAEARAAAAVRAANAVPFPKTRTGNQDYVADQRRRSIAAALGAVGGASSSGSSGSAGSTGGTQKDREAAARAQAVRESVGREVLARADEPTTRAGRAFEPSDDADERNARIQREQLRRADMTYAAAPKRKAFSESYKDRVEPLDETLKALENEAKEEATSKKADPNTLPKFTAATRRRFLEVADQMAGANDVSPDRIVRSLYNATQRLAPDAQPRPVTDGEGNVFMRIGTEQFVVDRDTFRRIAEMRADTLSRARVSNREALEKKNNPPPPAVPRNPQPAPPQEPATDYQNRGRDRVRSMPGLNPMVSPEEMEAIGRRRMRQYGIPTE